MPNNSSARALVLFSGGQDSTTCLAWALETYDHVETISFDYGQRHAVELVCRDTIRNSLIQAFPRWAEKLGADTLVPVPSLKALGETAMTDAVEIAALANGLPNTFVPGRNLLFLTLAAALAYRRDIGVLVGGMCETDYSGYPDCRSETLEVMATALTLGMDKRFTIQTPLMKKDKAQTWAMASDIGGKALTEIITHDTHTCYLGDRNQLHDWGYGCGTCPACELRAKGFAQWRAST